MKQAYEFYLRIRATWRQQLILIVLISLLSQETLAATSVQQFSNTISHTISLIKDLIIRLAFLCGMVFIMLGLFKFKAHKDNPQQIPMSTPLVLMAVGAGLIFLPTFFELVGSALFDTAAKPGMPLIETIRL